MSGREQLRDVVRHDWNALLHSGTGLVLLLLLPAVLFLAVEAEQSERPARVLIAGSLENPEVTERLREVMGESSEVKILDRWKDAVAEPLAVVREKRLDVLLNYEGSTPQLSMYTAETDPRRLADLERIGAGIVRAEAVIAHRVAARNEARRLSEENRKKGIDPKNCQVPVRQALFETHFWASSDLYEDLFMLGPLPILPLAEYYPQAADPRVTNLPTLILLILSLLPFALAVAMALSNDVAIAPSPRVSWREAAIRTTGRVVVPAVMTLLELLAILLLAEWILDVHIKAGVFRMALLVFASVLGSACAGLAVVAVSRTRVDTAVWCTLYVLAVVLLTASPLSRQPEWVQAVALALPVTHLQPVLTGWLFGAPYDVSALWTGGRLLLLALSVWSIAVFFESLRGKRFVAPAVLQ